ncbi:MAG: hypothetical protein UX26_C0018G0008 [Parcubacteria group bacterium GW2011_GWC1_45_9]|uniref:Uncharacterized protein n=1 Tax=Candidatus Woesebacteria bacterium GW2011_GWB1_44_11b TaxID=1618580 RepID=A0A0G1JFC9_9BACT|nr:MAG: hypothetical protein UW21_C0004G0009 [Candidatus Woesebacteria bacterium GW2011_GWB1_44_11b]KKT86427.1 MAG: hypothetical protein UW85_C0002G0028 [Parcubacteria group bacterium GW2011_GWA1_Parcubacteria_45_10]KKU16686.1 MAG: hypothetical protein UX26_C0018G0008 [Parcubacteria group bacterium GW2011_GWC1_45_9]HCI05427.1 hypothetical protein [Patescibacteria group bacterium]
MKKLKIIGLKNRFFGFGPVVRKQIATIYVKDGQVEVESELSSLRALRDRIQRGGETGGALLSHTVEEVGRRYKVNEPEFLEALTYEPLWEERYDGWDIHIAASKVVDE